MDDLFRKEMRFQKARDVIDSLIGYRSAWAYEEQHKSKPELALIEKWRKETSALNRKRENLEFEDDQTDAIIAKYRPQAIAETAVFLAQAEIGRG